MELLNFENINGLLQVKFHNGKYIGVIYQECDGYWVFAAINPENGFWSSPVLKMISSKLDELNVTQRL